MGRQVAFGIAEELLRLSISLGAEDRYPEGWLDPGAASKRTPQDPRFEVQYNPHLFAILAERLLLENGVKILYGSYAVGVSMAEERIAAVILHILPEHRQRNTGKEIHWHPGIIRWDRKVIS